MNFKIREFEFEIFPFANSDDLKGIIHNFIDPLFPIKEVLFYLRNLYDNR